MLMPDVQETIGTVGEVLNNADLSPSKAFYALLIIVVGAVIIRVVLMLIDRILRRSHFDESIKKVFRNVNKYLMWIVLAIIVLGYLNVEVTSLVALLSVAALAVSLALQNLLSNVAGGLQLLYTKPYAIGDYIEVSSVAGTVMETGLFYTRIRTFDYKLIQVPNSQITEEKIINYSAEATRRVDVKINAPYYVPVEQVKRSIMGMLTGHPKILADPEPSVRINSFGDSAIEYFIRAWCANADYWDVYFDVLEGIKAAFDRDGIEMTYNHLNVHMVEDRCGE